MTRERLEQQMIGCLRQGISPRRLALTLALGFTIGCVPVIGIPTVACAAVALVWDLNLPAIQAANYVAMPLQLALIVPFFKLGTRVSAFAVRPDLSAGLLAGPPALKLAVHAGGMAGEAMFGWLLVAVPAALLMTAIFTVVLRRIPWVNSKQLSIESSEVQAPS